jgi:hypothetical protein
MDEQEKQFWAEQFRTLQVDWEAAIKRATGMATRYGKLCQKVDTFIGKRWYEKVEVWIRIVTTAIILLVAVIILWRGGYVKYKDVEFGLHPRTISGSGSTGI